MKAALSIFVIATLATSCERKTEAKPEPVTAVGKDGWLHGTTDEKFDTVAKHLRGNDVVMWEIGYRHAELYQAIHAHNREYALYQFEKILLAMEMGVERRPPRRASYETFFTAVKVPMTTALKEGDPSAQLTAYQAMTAHCAVCHATEQVAWIPVNHPWENRTISNE